MTANLYKHQREMIELSPRYHLLAWACGTGKTATSIGLAVNNANEILVVCPKSLIENWQREVLKWAPQFKKKDVAPFFTYLTKEQFKKEMPKLRRYDGIIIDEAHFFAGFKSQMYKSMVKYLNKAKPDCVYLLTATPYMSTPYNIMCYETLLGRKANYVHYKRRFFTDVRMGSRVIPVVRSGIEDEIAEIVRSLGSTQKIEDCVDMPPKVYQREDFKLTSSQKKAIKALEDNPMMTTHIVYWTAQHRICGGTTKSLDDEVIQLKSEKLKRIKDYAKQYKKFVVVCRYNSEIEMINEALPGRCVTLNGKTKDRQALIDYANTAPHCIFLVQSSMSEGYNLTGFNKMIFYSNGFSLKDRIQMEGRIYRIGQTERCVYIDFVIKDQIDEDVMKCLRSKKDFDIKIYERRDTSIEVKKKFGDVIKALSKE